MTIGNAWFAVSSANNEGIAASMGQLELLDPSRVEGSRVLSYSS